MLITRKSPITKKQNTLEININEVEIQDWLHGMLIQHAMPNISAAEREFIKTGMTEEDWDSLLGEEE